MKNLAKNYNLKSITKWTFTNHEDWCDSKDHSVISVVVERITTLNNEIISKKVIESQDMVLRTLSKESMAAEAACRMVSHYMDEEVYVGF